MAQPKYLLQEEKYICLLINPVCLSVGAFFHFQVKISKRTVSVYSDNLGP